MDTENYYVLIVNEDGEVFISGEKKEEIGELINEYGGIDACADSEYLDNNSDLAYWGEKSVLIIKGKIVTPKPKKIIDSIEIE
jgi:hypothetical protein